MTRPYLYSHLVSYLLLTLLMGDTGPHHRSTGLVDNVPLLLSGALVLLLGQKVNLVTCEKNSSATLNIVSLCRIYLHQYRCFKDIK